MTLAVGSQQHNLTERFNSQYYQKMIIKFKTLLIFVR